MNDSLSNYINLTRWVSALLVVIGHVRGMIFVEYALLENKSVIAQGFYFIAGFGHQAVIVFFVLSGFLVGGRVIERVQKGTFRFKEYFLDRLSRLYTVVLFALILGYVLDLVGSQYFSGSGLYRELPRNFGISHPEANLSLDIFFGNLFFLQTIVVPTLGTNGPLWSLANEFAYYIIFPVFTLLIMKQFPIVPKMMLYAMSIAIILLLPINILSYIPVWLLGAAIYSIKKPIVSHFYITLLILIVVLVFTRYGTLPVIVSDYLLAIAFALSLQTLNSANFRHVPFALFNKFMADFSFSLYTIHFPVMVFILSFLQTVDQSFIPLKRFDVRSVFIYIIIVVMVYMIAYAFSLLTEKNTRSVRNQLRRMLA